MSLAVLEAAVWEKPCLLTPAADPNGALGRAGGAVVVDGTPEASPMAFATICGLERAELLRHGTTGALHGGHSIHLEPSRNDTDRGVSAWLRVGSTMSVDTASAHHATWIPSTAFAYWTTRGFWAVVDQALFAVSNLIINVLLARWLSPRRSTARSSRRMSS